MFFTQTETNKERYTCAKVSDRWHVYRSCNGSDQIIIDEGRQCVNCGAVSHNGILYSFDEAMKMFGPFGGFK